MGIFEKPIALDPGVGGQSIGVSALEPADIIVSTTSAKVSLGIRVKTKSVVSHTALYAGGGDVIEAIGAGVTRRTIEASLTEDVLAVAYRSPGLPPTMGQAIIGYASSQIGVPYSVPGAVLSASKVLCRIAGPMPVSFFCSQLVIQSYARGGRPLTHEPANCVTPDDVVVIAAFKLTYIGHLKGNAAWFPQISP